MRRALVMLLLALWLPALSASPLLAEGGASPAPEAAAPSVWAHAMHWVVAQQQALHRQLAAGMEQVQAAPSAANTLALVAVGFLYGVFHAAGPGHGKAVITTYLLTHREHMRRALALSWASSLLQGAAAIALVFVVVVLAERLTRDALAQVTTLEQISYALVAMIGLWLMVRAARALYRLRAVPAPFRLLGAAPTAPHGHGADHGADDGACGCGHAHHVTPAQAAGSASLGAMVGTVVAVGLRPCTGAILVLAVANMLGLWPAGLAAVLAMSVGTAITVSALAVLAVTARHWAGRAAVRAPSLGLQRAGQAAALAGGAVIALVGLSLLAAGASDPVPPLLR